MSIDRVATILPPWRSAIGGLIVLSLAACATQRYGRLTPVSPGERANLTCEQVALEIEKAEFFLADIRRQRSQTTGAHVLGALGDFGIGNVMEGDAAEKSGMDRLDQLKALERDKGCATTKSGAATGGTMNNAEPGSTITNQAARQPEPSRENQALISSGAQSNIVSDECRRKRGTSQQSGPYTPWNDLPC